MMEGWNKGRRILSPITQFFATKNISPALLTVLGVMLSSISAYFYIGGRFIFGAIFLALGGIFDVLDGEVARKEGRVSKKGAYLDSTLDRISEFIPLFGILFYYINKDPVSLSLTAILIFGSIMVSYTRARAEGLGIQCRVGFADRPFRLIFLIIGSLCGERIFTIFLAFLVVSVIITFIMRMVYSLRRL